MFRVAGIERDIPVLIDDQSVGKVITTAERSGPQTAAHLT